MSVCLSVCLLAVKWFLVELLASWLLKSCKDVMDFEFDFC